MPNNKHNEVVIDNSTAMILHELGKISGQIVSLEKHTQEWREMQAKNNEAIWSKINEQDARIRENEIKHGKKTVVISAVTSVGMALISGAVALGVKNFGS